MWTIPAVILTVLFSSLIYRSVTDGRKMRAADVAFNKADLALKSANEYLATTIKMNEDAKKSLEMASAILKDAQRTREAIELERERLREIASELSALDKRAAV